MNTKLQIRIKLLIFLLLLINHSNISSAQDLFNKILENLNSQYDKINSFTMEVEKTIYIEKDNKLYPPQTISYTFDFMKNQYFKIHYKANDIERILIGNEDYIVEYIPAYNQALKTTLNGLSTKTKKQKYFKATKLVNIPYLFIHDELSLLDFSKVEVSNGNDIMNRPTYLLKFQREYEGKDVITFIWIDRERYNILKTIVKDRVKDFVFINIKYEDIKKYLDSIWISHKITFKINSKIEKARQFLKFTNLIFNNKFPESYFTFNPSNDIKLTIKPAKKEK